MSVETGQKHIDDFVNHPPHYNRKGIECLDAIEASMEEEEWKGYLKGNTMKYLWRYTYKGNAVEDLRKAEFYLKKLIKQVEDDEKALQTLGC